VETLKEPATFEIEGLMSFPRLDFEVGLRRDLAAIGATPAEIEAYVEGLRTGGTLLFATGSADQDVEAAMGVMNRSGVAPRLPEVAHESMFFNEENPVLTGRVRQEPEGARLFFW
jgi:hypothetical protein